MNLGDALFYYTKQLKEAGFENPRLEVEILIGKLLGLRRAELMVHDRDPVTSEQAVAIGDMISRRLRGEPSAYIIGQKDFYKYSFKVGPGVLIPRPETELIVEQAILFLGMKKGHAILDLGAGSGCIGLSLLREFSDLKAALIEKSPSAIPYLRANAATLGVLDRAAIFESNVEGLEFEDAFEVVVANPPYLSEADPLVERNVRRYEPMEALFANNEGFSAIESWARVAARAVMPGGLVLFEIGHDQGLKARELFEKLGVFNRVNILKDLSGHDRVVRATKRS